MPGAESIAKTLSVIARVAPTRPVIPWAETSHVLAPSLRFSHGAIRRSVSGGLILIVGLAISGCGGTDGDVIGPAADYTLSLAPAALTVAQGAAGNTAVAVARTNFAGAITLSLVSAPSGVIGSFDPQAPGGTTSTLVVSVGAAVTPGLYNLSVAGAATAGNRSTPLVLTVTSSAGGLATALAVGGFHACALVRDGAAYCWGNNNFGQLGNGTISAGSSTPGAAAGALRFSAIAAGGEGHTCAVITSGAAYCWGGNYYGTLGNGSSEASSPTPVAVSGGLSFSSLALGPGAHSCGLTASGLE